MTFSPSISFYNYVPSPSLDHVLYVHSRSYFSFHFPHAPLRCFFFPAQHYIGGSLDPNVQHWDLHSLRPFHFPALLLDCTHFVFFFPAQHCIGRSLDPNDHHWEMHSIRPSFHFPGLLVDSTQCKFSFCKAQHCIGRSLDPNDQMWDTHSLKIFHFGALLLDCTQSKFQRIVQK